MNVVFIFGGDFPVGGAYTTRMHGFAKGLAENGHTINFLVVNPGRDLLSTNILRGTFDKVDFTYTCKHTKKSPKKFKQLYNTILGTIGSVAEVLRIQRKCSIDALIFGTNTWFRVMPLYILSRIYKIKIVHKKV